MFGIQDFLNIFPEIIFSFFSAKKLLEADHIRLLITYYIQYLIFGELIILISELFKIMNIIGHNADKAL